MEAEAMEFETKQEAQSECDGMVGRLIRFSVSLGNLPAEDRKEILDSLAGTFESLADRIREMKGSATWTKNVNASDAENHFVMVAEGINATNAIGIVVTKLGELLDYNPELVADIEKSLKADLILPSLNLGDLVTICVGINDKDREAYAEIGPRDWRWDTDTGELIGCGTTLGDQQQA
ncbi:MAG: hypothetical protein WBL50_18385 [Candidatus Acidiferrum sp.]